MTVFCLATIARPPAADADTPFIASVPALEAAPARIVIQYDQDAGTGADWSKAPGLKPYSWSPAAKLLRAAEYLHEAITRMTGREPTVLSSNDLSTGIVLTTLDAAPTELQNDPAVIDALKNTGEDDYNHQEAFFIRSEADRLLLIANTPDGLLNGVVELLETVGYEVLGMGPNWVHVPNYHDKPLVFTIERSGRPSFYIRNLWATTGQERGWGTVGGGALTHPDDEGVQASYRRWRIGRRMVGQSMPDFPGHALQGYHRRAIAHMVEHNLTEGFLTARTVIGPLAGRPDAAPENDDWMWIDPQPAPGDNQPQVFTSNGKAWEPKIGLNLDLSVPFVRQLLLAAMIRRAVKSFEEHPDKPMIMAMDAEDGASGNAVLGERMRYPTWYPDYLAREGAPFGRPYVLHGYRGLDQPRELWDPASPSDNMFACATFLLREFDKWVDSLPEEERVTSTGRSKKDLVRVSFYSYNYHDVPPNFNPDQRIRVMIAGYPKHRGRGKWEAFRTHEDVARAFQIMLPREPSGDYRIISLAAYWDTGLEDGIRARWSASPAAIVDAYGGAYDAGFRAMSCETDFNFGKLGLAYYLITQVLWDASLTADELDAVRDRWFQRSFGSAWEEMKAYYDFMLRDNYLVNGPNSWAHAIRLIDAADRRLDGDNEQAAQRRIDDVKQFWYYHYLASLYPDGRNSPEFKTFFWKGQMSYMVPMHMVMRRHFKTKGYGAAATAVGVQIRSTPAHYTHEQTQEWWARVLNHWQLTPVDRFETATLADGRSAAQVDLNDLVAVEEFQGGIVDAPFRYNSGMVKRPMQVLTAAARQGDPIGFVLTWPDSYPGTEVSYGVDIWNAADGQWEPWIDIETATQASSAHVLADGETIHMVNVTHDAPRPGTYRISVGRGGNLAKLGAVGYDPVNNGYARTVGFTFAGIGGGHTQEPTYFYIPKGTRSLDLEVWKDTNRRSVVLFKGLSTQGDVPRRTIDISAVGTYTIALEPGEDRTVAAVYSNGFAFPYLYSVPTLYAKSPGALLVPRAIAEADGLTIVR